jgi:hypothetical protein
VKSYANLAGLMFLLASCAAVAPTPTPDSGIQGQVTLGPICPVMNVDSPCPDRPFAATLNVMDAQQKHVLATIKTDETGRFRQPVPPGDFVLVPVNLSTSAPPWANPIPFHLAPDQWLTLDVSYDSGIR